MFTQLKSISAVSPMAEAKDSSASCQKPFFLSQIFLRIFAIVFTAASLAVMVTDSQTVIVFALPFEAHYYYSAAFKFFVVADGVVCGFSVVSLIMVFVGLKNASGRVCCFRLLFHDIAMTVLMMSGCAAATAIGYVAYNGESNMTWGPICDQVHKFCIKATISILLGYLAFLAYLGLTLLTACRLNSS